VVLLHVWMFTDRHGDFGHWWGQLLIELRLGVPFFFVLSGFLIWRPWAQAALSGRDLPALASFVSRRAARILPAYWMTLAAAAMVLAGSGHPRALDSIGQGVALLTMSQTYFEFAYGALNPPAWTLVVESAFYALVPLAGWLAVRHGRTLRAHVTLLGALVAVEVAWCAWAELAGWPGRTFAMLPAHTGEFAFGMMAAAWTVAARPSGRALARAGLGLVAVAVAWHLSPYQQPWEVAQDLPAAAGFALLIAALTLGAGWQRPLSTGPLHWLGERSYGIYLWHFVVLFAWQRAGMWPSAAAASFSDTLLAMGLVAPVAIALAAATYRWVELPAVGWARRRERTPRRDRARVPAPALG
jgi:peptidoglycan/LPS O-acetylase OafA/YrhL